MGGPDMAPHTPPRSGRLGGAVAPLYSAVCFAAERLGVAAERFGEVSDHRAQICAGGERLLERGEDRGAFGGRRAVPAGAEGPGQARLFVLEPRTEALPLFRESCPRRLVERSLGGLAARLGQRLLDLEHLLQKRGRRLRL